jgi:hypothetical protein
MFCTVVREGREGDLNYLLDKLNTINDNVIKREISNGLCCTKETWVLNKLLHDNLNGSEILNLLKYISSNPNGNLIAWNFLKNHWHSLHKR